MNPGMWSWRPPQHQPHHKTARGKREGSKGSQTTAPREACRKYRAFQCSHSAGGQLSSCFHLSRGLGGSSSSSVPRVPWNQHRVTHGSVWQHHHGCLVPLTLIQHQHQPLGTSARFSGGSQSRHSVMDCFALALPTCKSCCFVGVFFWPSLPPSLPLPSLLLHEPGATTHPISPGAEQSFHHTISSRGKQAADQNRPQG